MNLGTVAILGPGLIGGSLALALAERGLAERLVIYARSAHALDAIRLAGVSAELTGNPSEAVREADVVILCVPIEAMAALIAECRDALKPDALVTDVGSVKGSVDAALAPLLKEHAQWIGSHPMAGSEQSGFVAARADLFENAAIILTPTPQTSPATLQRAETFWKALGGRLYTMAPADHDLAVADISHVPHLLASLLVANANPKSLPLAGGGFRDTTRIAAGSAELWTEILWANRDALAKHCHAWSEQLAQIQRLFSNGDANAKSELFKLLENAQSVRSQLMDKKSFSPKATPSFLA
jgi:prephenate dehydrogenase